MAASRHAPTAAERKKYKKDLYKVMETHDYNTSLQNNYITYLQLISYSTYVSEEELNFANKIKHKSLSTYCDILIKHKGLSSIKNFLEENIDNPELTSYLIELSIKHPKFMEPYMQRIKENALIYQQGLELFKRSDLEPVVKKLRGE